MNKRVITTSLAVLLAMTMVLAVGKTRTVEDGKTTSRTVTVAQVNQPEISVEAEETIITEDSHKVISDQVGVVQSHQEEEELILTERPGTMNVDGMPTSEPLIVSLERMQNALEHLQQVSRETEMAVAVLEQQRLR